MFTYIVLMSVVILLSYGVYEQRKNNENIKNIKIRINVNGIRGKSTITRLITSVLAEEGLNVIGKTTGTAPRIIINQNEEEIEIVRKPIGVNILEQLKVIDFASNENAEALVCECMAVNPEYQKIYQEKMISANVGVIINVLEDHIDVMGPSLDEIALAFSSTIPYDGILVIQENEYSKYFTDIAKRRRAEVFIADESQIPKGYLDQFTYVVFPNNIAITLAVSEALNISKDTALAGMLKANPDPGSLALMKYENNNYSFLFANGFAINDPSSALEAWDFLKEREFINSTTPVIVFNARADRVDRTLQFVNDFFNQLSDRIILVAIGDELSYFKDNSLKHFSNNIEKSYLFDGLTIDLIFDELLDIFNNRTVYFVGNIHGHGYDLLHKFEFEKGIY